MFRISGFGFRVSALARLLLLVLLGGALSSARATVSVSSLYGNNMVIQRDKPFPVCGTAAPNTTITVAYNSQTNSTTSDAQGSWQLTLPAMSAKATGSNFTINEAGGNTITLVNVVVGDVWLCSGQSNMAFTLSGCNRPADVSSASFPGLRHFWVGTANLSAPTKTLSGSWSVCSPTTASGYSAVGFYFGRKIYLDQAANVPIGLIASTVGGTRIDPWLAPEGCYDLPVLAPLYSQSSANYGPFSLFNGMIYPLAPFPMKGVIWYQGENSETTVQSADSYFLKMKGLAQGWQRLLGLNDFAFYFVQIAYYGAQPTSPAPVLFSGGWDADTRLQQADAMALPHAGMASAVDLGDSGDYHPTDKLDVGERLALWALKNEYGQTNLATSGPLLRDVTVSSNKAICSFTHIGSGLMVGVKRPYQPTVETNLPLALFSIAGTNGTWYWATATIVGDTVELTSPSVASPAKVAYACWQNPIGLNLYNRDGLPASPFYVDDVTAKYTVTASAGAGGSISPAGASSYLKRMTARYSITPEPGSYILGVKVDGASVGSVKSYTFDPLYADHTIAATFTNVAPVYTIAAAAGLGGSMSPSGAVAVVQGESQNFVISPNPGNTVALTVDGRLLGARTSFSFPDVRANHSLAASFTCTIRAGAGAGGRIFPTGNLVVPAGTNLTFTITPSPYYQVANVQVDGMPQGPLTTYTFTNVTASHTIGVGFLQLPPTLAFSASGAAGLEITWPAVYTGQLLWSPTLGPGAVWSPVPAAPAYSNGFYTLTVSPGAGTGFYGLSQ